MRWRCVPQIALAVALFVVSAATLSWIGVAHVAAAASPAHQPCPTAPISPLAVFGRPQDLAFEHPISDVQNREHIRLWLTETRFDGQAVWVAQASSDHGIELSAATVLPTHHIAPAVDRERAVIGADLQRTSLVTSEVRIAFASPVLSARNAGDDFYATDGDALLINFTTAPVALRPSAWVIEGLKTQVFLLYDALVSLPLWIVVGLALGATLVLGVALAWLVHSAPVTIDRRIGKCVYGYDNYTMPCPLSHVGDGYVPCANTNASASSIGCSNSCRIPAAMDLEPPVRAGFLPVPGRGHRGIGAFMAVRIRRPCPGVVAATARGACPINTL